MPFPQEIVYFCGKDHILWKVNIIFHLPWFPPTQLFILSSHLDVRTNRNHYRGQAICKVLWNMVLTEVVHTLRNLLSLINRSPMICINKIIKYSDYNSLIFKDLKPYIGILRTKYQYSSSCEFDKLLFDMAGSSCLILKLKTINSVLTSKNFLSYELHSV